MDFILVVNALKNFKTIRAQYEKEKHLELNDTTEKAILGLPTLFGGPDLKARNKQVKFLEKMYAILEADLVDDDKELSKEELAALLNNDVEALKGTQSEKEQLLNELKFQYKVNASRVMIAACDFVFSQISSQRKSVLYRILEDNLGITSNNRLSEQDKEICYLVAETAIKKEDALSKANATLATKGLKPFTPKEWDEFSQFIKDKSEQCKNKTTNTNYPITSITIPLFGTAFSWVGLSAGLFIGDTISKSAMLIPTRGRLAATVGTLLVLGPVSPMGAALFASTIADKLAFSFCNISVGHLLSMVLNLVGQGVGMGVGLPLDLANNLLWKVFSIIGNQFSKTPNTLGLTGIRIADGVRVINGIEFKLVSEDELPADYKDHALELNADGTFTMAGEEQATDAVISELKEQFRKSYEEFTEESAAVASI